MTQEYETLMFPSSTDQKEIRDTLNIYGQGRWKLVNSYVTQRIGDKNGTMFIFMREVTKPFANEPDYFLPLKITALLFLAFLTATTINYLCGG